MARVLLADDDPDIRALLNFKLTLVGHDVVAVADGAQALVEFRAHVFDVGVFDVQMPGLTGLELLEAIRADGGDGAGLPVVLVTALATDSDERRGRAAGADDYLRKPFGLNELVLRIAALL